MRGQEKCLIAGTPVRAVLRMVRAGSEVVFQGKGKFIPDEFSAKSRIFIYVGVAQWIVQSPPKRKIGRSSRLTNV